MASETPATSQKTDELEIPLTNPLNILKTTAPRGPVTKLQRHLKFVGPLVIVIDSGRDYCWTVWFAIVLGVIKVLIGAVNMVAWTYSAATGDAHAALCTIAYHFFSAEAILSLNFANGWSTPLRLRHRKFAHVILQICAMACAITGTVLIVISKGLKLNPHGITGVITAALAGLSILSGPCALFARRRAGHYLRLLHIGLGMPTFLASSISLCLGLLTNAFKNWATTTIVYILIGFVAFYTVFMIGTVFVKCASRI